MVESNIIRILPAIIFSQEIYGLLNCVRYTIFNGKIITDFFEVVVNREKSFHSTRKYGNIKRFSIDYDVGTLLIKFDTFVDGQKSGERKTFYEK